MMRIIAALLVMVWIMMPLPSYAIIFSSTIPITTVVGNCIEAQDSAHCIEANNSSSWIESGGFCAMANQNGCVLVAVMGY